MKIPVRVSPLFFLVAGVIGYLNSGNILGTLFWIGVIFVSILFHEYGHALMSRFFGQHPRIEIIAFGGLTYPDGVKLPPWKEFLVVFAGPFFGFLLFLGATALLQFSIGNSYLVYFLRTMQFVNLFWTVINLIPVLPLDGGQLVRIILEKFFGVRAWKYAYIFSIAVATAAALFFFTLGAYFIGAIFGLFAFQNFVGLQQTRTMTEADQSPSYKQDMQEIEMLIEENRLEEAKHRLETLCQQTNKGIVHRIAAETLAKIYFEQGNIQSAYSLLLQEKNALSDQSKYLLHMVAFEIQDYALVLELSPQCFRSVQSIDIALRAAAASAAIENENTAIEWLKTAQVYGQHDLQEVVKDRMFDKIRQKEAFKKFCITQFK